MRAAGRYVVFYIAEVAQRAREGGGRLRAVVEETRQIFRNLSGTARVLNESSLADCHEPSLVHRDTKIYVVPQGVLQLVLPITRPKLGLGTPGPSWGSLRFQVDERPAMHPSDLPFHIAFPRDARMPPSPVIDPYLPLDAFPHLC